MGITSPPSRGAPDPGGAAGGDRPRGWTDRPTGTQVFGALGSFFSDLGHPQ